MVHVQTPINLTGFEAGQPALKPVDRLRTRSAVVIQAVIAKLNGHHNQKSLIRKHFLHKKLYQTGELDRDQGMYYTAHVVPSSSFHMVCMLSQMADKHLHFS